MKVCNLKVAFKGSAENTVKNQIFEQMYRLRAKDINTHTHTQTHSSLLAAVANKAVAAVRSPLPHPAVAYTGYPPPT